MLTTVLRIAASNALAAALLAVVVVAVCRIVARPALARALWVLVLIKLLTPPLWTIPLDGFLGHASDSSTLNGDREPAPVSYLLSDTTDAASIDQSERVPAFDAAA